MIEGVLVTKGEEAIHDIYEQFPLVDWYYSLYSTDAVVDQWGDYSREIGERVAKAGVYVKELIAGNNRPVPYADYYNNETQEIRYLPRETKIDTDLIVFEGRVVLISYDDLKVITIDDDAIFQTVKQMFEMLWEGTPMFIDVEKLLST